MGRYYSGDIEGKFWFGVQDSTDASFFGVYYSEPNYVDYYFDKDNLESIKSGIKKCKEALGTHKKILDAFFKSVEGYNDEMIIKYYEEKHNKKITADTIKYLLEWYARLKLGEKILKCVQKNGSCSFTAEL